MALSDGDLIEIVVNMTILSQQTLNVWQYEVGNFVSGTSLVQILEGYWNHVKSTYRGVVATGFGNVFVSLKGREMNDPAGDYAEFDIPVGERAGTRASGGDLLPPYSATAVRLVVGTRATKPGGKRFAGLTEADQASGVLNTLITTPMIALMNVMTANMTLGAPAALNELNPIVARKDANGFVTAWQPITGYLINPNVSTQNSRKFGRGA